MKSRVLVMMGTLSACALDTGAQSVELELEVAGSDVGSDFEGRDGARISLDRADLAFGPLYLCRGQQSGADVCDTAALEWTDAIVVDALSPEPTRAGLLEGTEGRVRSFMYDLGLHSLLTQKAPLVLPAARELGANSVVLVGEAEQGGRRFPFRFEVAVEQSTETRGVPVVVSSETGSFDEDIDEQTQGLRVVFDPRTWLSNVRFGAFVDERTCADTEPPSHVCAADAWQTCDGAGGVEREVDCADEGDVCVADMGCRAAFTAPEESQAWRSVRNGLTTGERPRFRFYTTE